MNILEDEYYDGELLSQLKATKPTKKLKQFKLKIRKAIPITIF